MGKFDKQKSLGEANKESKMTEDKIADNPLSALVREYKWVRTDPNNPDVVPVPLGEGWILSEPTIREIGYYTYYRLVSEEDWRKAHPIPPRRIGLMR